MADAAWPVARGDCNRRRFERRIQVYGAARGALPVGGMRMLRLIKIVVLATACYLALC